MRRSMWYCSTSFLCSEVDRHEIWACLRDKRHRLPINYSSSKDYHMSCNVPCSFLNFSNGSPYCKGGQTGLRQVVPAAVHSLKAVHKPSLNSKDIPHAYTRKKEKSLCGSCEFTLCKIWKSFRIKLKLMTYMFCFITFYIISMFYHTSQMGMNEPYFNIYL